jgi:hypothetical protein
MKPVYGTAKIDLVVNVYLKISRAHIIIFLEEISPPSFQPIFSSNQVHSIWFIISQLKYVRCPMSEYTVRWDIKPRVYIE